MYVRSLTAPPEVADGPIGVGAEVYGSCSSLPRRQPARAAPAGRSPTARSLKTFPHIEDQLRFVYFGTEDYNLAGVTIYGDPDREGGAHDDRLVRRRCRHWGATAGGDLTDAEILAVVCHERYTLGGADPTEPTSTPRSTRTGAPRSRRSSPPSRRARRSPTSTPPASPTPTATPIEIIDIGDAPVAPASPDRRRVDRRRAVRPPIDPVRRSPRHRRAATPTSVPDAVIVTDVLVVGGGPAGAAAGYWLARHGHDVTVVERKTFPREKTCGDGLTPRAVHQLDEMGLDQRARPVPPLPRAAGDGHGPRARAGVAEPPDLPEPRLRRAPPRPRRDGRRQRRRRRRHAARGPRGGPPDRRPRASSAARRSPATTARASTSAPSSRSSPTAPTAASAGPSARRAPGSGRTARRSARTGRRPRHADPWIESALDVKDRNGNPMPGLRLDLPGRRRHREHRRRPAVDVPRLQERQHHPPARRLRPPDRRPLGDRPGPTRSAGRRAGGSRWAARVGPKAGPTYLVVGDAAGSVNPFNGEGIDYAYETARMAADVDPRGAQSRATPRRCSATRSCSTTSTASTSRSPACSPG